MDYIYVENTLQDLCYEIYSIYAVIIYVSTFAELFYNGPQKSCCLTCILKS